jgi:hypothetical protein
MHTIFVSDRLADSHGSLLVRVLKHKNFGKLDPESATSLAMLVEHVRDSRALCVL